MINKKQKKIVWGFFVVIAILGYASIVVTASGLKEDPNTWRYINEELQPRKDLPLIAKFAIILVLSTIWTIIVCAGYLCVADMKVKYESISQ